jgi:hypothetical protein
MRKLCLSFVAILFFIFFGQCQYWDSDTLSAKVLWINNLNKIYIIGIMPDVKFADTIIVVSEVDKCIKGKANEIKVSGTYTWAVRQK